MTRSGGLFCLGDVVPDGYFTEAEIADLTARGKVTVEVEELEPAKAAPVVEAAPVVDDEETEETEELDLGGEKKHSAKRWGKK